ncbi:MULTISPECIES: tRNA lysidine(34) synthetase TilS [Flavobacteriaceae]|uniref:tRNA lysidine(34) synthetase TilS n=1 Tax=Flavobacteriaceae TaxID=49546 RepID=UPI00234948B7|nr:tRNA lysidine(34) synthetase TilS [Muricauda sp. SP22]MDC6363203.1 tRNA lysidine(34) synthetase TilS [Muricauda sp. SP22]
MLKQFTEHINSNLPFLKEKPLLLACSGGVDSVVLAHLCVASGLKVTLAHCNFQLRGEESDTDEIFVQDLGEKLGLEVITHQFDTEKYAVAYRGSIQMAARELRYQWFNEVLNTGEFDFVLTAHHADDDLETFLINLSRGTGIEGLSGIPVQNEKVIRPLLNFSRQEILDHAKNNALEWREDSSNSESKYLRNKIRLDIVPQLKTLHPTFLENFKRTQSHLEQTQSLVRHHVEEIRKKLFESQGDIIRVSVEKLQGLKPLVGYLYELFRAYGFTEWNDVEGLLHAMSGKEVRSKTHRLVKDRTHLILSPIETGLEEVFWISDDVKELEKPINLRLQNVKTIENTGRNTIYLDKEKLNFPLLLRNWEKGDYFYPYGMDGKKKLSKFFKDEKVDVISKEKQWLLCSNDTIAWVVGRRADKRFKVEDSTKDILKITLVT